MYALSACWSAAKTKSKTRVQTWPAMRQEMSFIRLAIIQTQEWTAVLKKQFVSKLHPTETHIFVLDEQCSLEHSTS